MFKPLLRAAAPVFLLASVPLAAQQPQPIAAADMFRHIQVLASDRFEGRAPATAGEQDAPWPPNYAKQDGEPPRVAPSRRKKKTE